MLLYCRRDAVLLLLGRRSSVEALSSRWRRAIAAICAYALAWRLVRSGRGAYQIGAADQLAGFGCAADRLRERPRDLRRDRDPARARARLRGRAPLLRALASSALVILAPTLYFTYGRALGRLAAGLVAVRRSEHDRLRGSRARFALAAAPASPLLLASRAHELTSAPGRSPPRGTTAPARRRARRPRRRRRLRACGARARCSGTSRSAGPAGAPSPPASLVAVAVVAAGLVAWAARTRRPAAPTTRSTRLAPLVKTDTSRRLFSLSGSNRSSYWHVAWREVEAHPCSAAGRAASSASGCATGRRNLPVLDAHSLYLETLAELGRSGCSPALRRPPRLSPSRTLARSPLAAAALGATSRSSSTPRSTGTGRCPPSR
jgi:hypothetical protein